MSAKTLEGHNNAHLSHFVDTDLVKYLVGDLNRGRPLHAEMLNITSSAGIETHDRTIERLRNDLVDEGASARHSESPRGFVPRGLTHVSITDVIGALPKFPVNPVCPQYSSIGIAA